MSLYSFRALLHFGHFRHVLRKLINLGETKLTHLLAVFNTFNLHQSGASSITYYNIKSATQYLLQLHVLGGLWCQGDVTVVVVVLQWLGGGYQ